MLDDVALEPEARTDRCHAGQEYFRMCSSRSLIPVRRLDTATTASICSSRSVLPLSRNRVLPVTASVWPRTVIENALVDAPVVREALHGSSRRVS